MIKRLSVVIFFLVLKIKLHMLSDISRRKSSRHALSLASCGTDATPRLPLRIPGKLAGDDVAAAAATLSHKRGVNAWRADYTSHTIFFFCFSWFLTNSRWAVTRPPRWMAAPKAICNWVNWEDRSRAAHGVVHPLVQLPITVKRPRSLLLLSCLVRHSCRFSLSCAFVSCLDGRRWWGLVHLLPLWNGDRWPPALTVPDSLKSAIKNHVDCNRLTIRECIRGMFPVIGV